MAYRAPRVPDSTIVTPFEVAGPCFPRGMGITVGGCTPPFGLSNVPGSLGWVPEKVKIDGIPNPVSGIAPNPDTFRRVPVPAGSRGTPETMALMRELAIEAAGDPFFIQHARGVVRGLGSKNYEEALARILDYVKTRVDYLPDPINEQDIDWLQSPGWTLFVEGQGDCDDLSMLIAALDLGVGLGAAYRALPLNKADPTQESHVYPLGGIRTSEGVIWLAQDAVPSVAELGWEPPQSEWAGRPYDVVVAVP